MEYRIKKLSKETGFYIQKLENEKCQQYKMGKIKC